jgi:hypothetical protein
MPMRRLLQKQLQFCWFPDPVSEIAEDSMTRARLVVVLTLLVSAAAAAYFTLLFVDNVSVAVQWRPVPPKAPVRGIIPRYDWAAVDIACFATLIPAVGMALIALGWLRVLLPHSDRGSRDFPFFAGHQSIIIATGLMGAVFGIIMVAYLPLGGEKDNIENLMVALRTALFSTLVALAWVYMIVPWVQPLMRAAYSRWATGEVEETISVEDVLRPLSEQLAILTDITHTATTQVVAMGNGAVLATDKLV